MKSYEVSRQKTLPLIWETSRALILQRRRRRRCGRCSRHSSELDIHQFTNIRFSAVSSRELPHRRKVFSGNAHFARVFGRVFGLFFADPLSLSFCLQRVHCIVPPRNQRNGGRLTGEVSRERKGSAKSLCEKHFSMDDIAAGAAVSAETAFGASFVIFRLGRRKHLHRPSCTPIFFRSFPGYMATIQGMPRARLLVINNDAGAPYISLLQSSHVQPALSWLRQRGEFQGFLRRKRGR